MEIAVLAHRKRKVKSVSDYFSSRKQTVSHGVKSERRGD
jgi:hypothetical protein